MIDIHCHILPGLDDGAESEEDSLQMAEQAAESGIRAIIATPHANLPREKRANLSVPELSEKLTALQRAIDSAAIPLKLYLGAELFATPALPELLQSQTVPTLAGSDYLLTEFFFDEDPGYMVHIFEEVRAAGKIPVVAHPERYDAIQEDPEIAADWFEAGYILQLNKGSLLGHLGDGAEQCSRYLLRRGLAHVAASDAHSPFYRTTDMRELKRFLESHCGHDYTEVPLELNPRQLLLNRPVLRA